MNLKQNLFNKIFVAIISYLLGIMSVISGLIISEGLGFETGSFTFVIVASVLTIVLFCAQFIFIGIILSFFPFVKFFPVKNENGSNEKIELKNDPEKIARLKKTIKIK